MALTKKQREAPFGDDGAPVAVRVVIYRLLGEDRARVIGALSGTVATVGEWHQFCTRVAKRVPHVDHSGVWGKLLKCKPGGHVAATGLGSTYRFERES